MGKRHRMPLTPPRPLTPTKSQKRKNDQDVRRQIIEVAVGTEAGHVGARTEVDLQGLFNPRDVSHVTIGAEVVPLGQNVDLIVSPVEAKAGLLGLTALRKEINNTKVNLAQLAAVPVTPLPAVLSCKERRKTGYPKTYERLLEPI